jgi:hypothetical protein
MKTKEIFLLIFIILAGVFFYHAYTGKLDIDWNWGWDNEEGFLSWGEEYVFEDSMELESPLPASLHLRNAYGNIEIIGSDTEQIAITLTKRIKRNSEYKAREVADELKMAVARNEGGIDISVNREDIRRKNFRTDFVLTVPSSLSVEIFNSYGLVEIRSVAGAKITSRIGGVRAENISGDLKLNISYRDADVFDVGGECRIDANNADLIVTNAKGPVDIKNRYGRVELADIPLDITIDGAHSQIRGRNLTGSLFIETSYKSISLEGSGPVKITASNSPIEIADVEGLVDIENNYGSVDLTNIRGDLLVKGKNLKVTGEDIIGSLLNITTSYRGVNLTRFSGKTTIRTDNGRIVLHPYPLIQGIAVSGQYTDIDFFWPEGRYPIEAQSQGGSVVWSLPYPLSENRENGLSLIKAFMDETTPSISLSTRYGKIVIQE